jgi:hypothetical protein
MSVLLVGAKGSMGRRYQAILRYLGRKFIACDIESEPEQVESLASRCAGTILASPTDTHAAYIRLLAPLKKPILCEKPVTKNVAELKDLLTELARLETPFRMMNQYRILADRSRIGKSIYDYFRHGNDGLYWDCMQIIGLARGEIRLGESSPVWMCMINGKALSVSHMDAAYLAYTQLWFQRPNQDPGEILATHEKTDQLEREMNG